MSVQKTNIPVRKVAFQQINKKYFALICALSLISIFLVRVVGANEQELHTSIDRIAEQIESLFPLVEGYVVSLEGRELVLDLKQGEPVKQGAILNLVRYGEEVIHPVTRKNLGRKEKFLGQLKVVRIGKNFSRARMVGKNFKAKVGDGFRSPFKKISFLIAPIRNKTSKKIDLDRLRMTIEKKLKAHPRFDIPLFNLEVWLLESGIDLENLTQPINLQRLRKEVKADYILVSTASSVKEKMILSYKLASSRDGSVRNRARVLSTQVPLLSSTKRPREQNIQTDFSSLKKRMPQFVAKQKFPFEIVDFDIGDVNGDGIKEYIIITRDRVMFYKLKDNKFKQITQVKARKGLDKFISVDVGDINRNGRDEIFITNKLGDRLSSFVLERNLKQKGFRKIWDKVNLYFRIIHPFGSKPTLLAQSPGFRNPFKGGIKTLLFRGGRYIEGAELEIPSIYGRPFILYGLTQTVSRNKKKNTIILDKDYHLRIYSPDGSLLVKSDAYYGHDPRVIDTGVKEEMGGVVQQGEPVHYRGRLQFVKSGGKKFLLIPKNYRAGGKLFSKMVVVNNSSLVILEITEEGFEKVVETKKQKGYIAAYQVMDSLKAEQKKIHVVTVQKGPMVEKAKSTIFTYDWSD